MLGYEALAEVAEGALGDALAVNLVEHRAAMALLAECACTA